MNESASAHAPASRTRAVQLAILFVVTIAVYARALFCDFVYYDDGLYVFDNAAVRNGISLSGMRTIFITGETGTWQPIALLSHMIDCQLFGLTAWGHHLTAVLIHGINAILLCVALTRMTGRYYPSLAVAAIFALHPTHVESVAWISERKDVLSTLFWILCLIAYTSFARCGGVGRYLCVVAMLVLGLMTKPMLVTVPCVLLLLDYWPLQRMDRGLGRLVGEKLLLFAVVIASCVITLIIQRQNQAIVSLENLPLSTRLDNVWVSYVKYIWTMVWPVGLAIDYPHPKDTLTSLQVTGSLAVLTGITAWAAYLWKRTPYFIVGWLWYLGTMVPVIGFVHVGEQGMADRYTYVPTIGLAILGVWCVNDFCKRSAYGAAILRAVAGLFLAVLCAWSVLTWKQIGYWKNTETLWARAVKVNPNHERAQRNLAALLMDRNDYANAIKHYKAAAGLNARDPRNWNGLGLAHLRLGDPVRALQFFETSQSVDPENVDTRNNIGVCLLKLNRDAEAEEVLTQAAGAGTADMVLAAEVTANLGVALMKRGKADEAERVLANATTRYADSAKLRNVYGVVLNSRGKRDEAIAQFREALRIDQGFEDAQRNLDVLGAK
ncbi:MAG: tetratricopeptide repeat protein [Candidatus Hydrogenedentes bacterium]|nr:tetratricopeptide repeat protein [Candidatus Hydrogenedentota bacterium]